MQKFLYYPLLTGAMAIMTATGIAAPKTATVQGGVQKKIKKVAVPGKTVPLILADNGQTQYTIALASDAIPAERTAASELGKYLEEISGAKFVIRAESLVASNAPQILIGQSSSVKSLLPRQNWAALGADGIVIKTVGNKLILAGGRPRGTLYAIYSFLEDTLGVRWWTETERTVPTRKTISIKPLSVVYTPQLKVRETFYFAPKDNRIPRYGPETEFGVQLKLNGHFQRHGPEFGGHYTNLGWCHTFNQLLPPEKYFKEHPEWYSDLGNGGKPSTAASALPMNPKWNLCLSNDAARKELTKNALEWIRANPTAGMISITQNDSTERCTCAADMAIEKEEGSPSGPLLRFVNKVAADIEKEYPDFQIETLAYLHTLKAPRTVRPRKNVVITLCSMNCNYLQPLNSKTNKVFRDTLLEWKNITPRLFIWDYLANFSNLIVPYPNMPTIGENIRFFTANNAVGLFEQGDAYTNGTGDFVAMRAWLVSHLMWNPQLDQTKLESEFLHGYYGAAAPHIRAYLNSMRQGFLKSDGWLPDVTWLTLDVLTSGSEHFRKAAAAVAGDPILADRVRRERIALDHAWILRYRDAKLEAERRGITFRGPADLAAHTKDFVETAQRFNTRQYNETSYFSNYAAQLLERSKPPAPLPAFARGKSPNDIIDGQESYFILYGAGDLVNIVADPVASNGQTAKMPGREFEWAIQYKPTEGDEFLKDGPWHCYALARVEAKPGAAPGPAISAGIFDVRNKKSIVAATTGLAELNSKEYQVIDLGVHEMDSDMTFFAAAPRRDDIDSVFVDRFLMVRERK